MFVIRELPGIFSPGYAFHSSIDGWIFTTLLNQAMRFKTEQEARIVIQTFYPTSKDQLEVVSLEKGGNR